MNLSDIRNTIAAYFKQTPAAFIVNGVDFLTIALNNARKKAERAHDFRLSGVSALLSFSSNTAAFTSATLADASTPVALKRIQYISLPIAASQYLPIEFLTEETFIARRVMQGGRQPYQPSNSLVQYGISETKPFAVQFGSNIVLYGASYTFPLVAQLAGVLFLPDYVSATTVVVAAAGTSGYNGNYTLYGQVNGGNLYLSTSLATALWYSQTLQRWYLTPLAQLNTGTPTTGYFIAATEPFGSGPPAPDGTYAAISGSTSGTPTVTSATSISGSDFFITYGPEYLQWSGILETNKYWLQFVAPRQEGNIPEDTVKQLADEALESLIAWDSGIYTGTTTPGLPPTAQPATTQPTLVPQGR